MAEMLPIGTRVWKKSWRWSGTKFDECRIVGHVKRSYSIASIINGKPCEYHATFGPKQFSEEFLTDDGLAEYNREQERVALRNRIVSEGHEFIFRSRWKTLTMEQLKMIAAMLWPEEHAH